MPYANTGFKKEKRKKKYCSLLIHENTKREEMAGARPGIYTPLELALARHSFQGKVVRNQKSPTPVLSPT